jgi:hypothetical protein
MTKPNPIPLWTPEHEALLRELHSKGLSFSQIAKAIGNHSRNSCIGKAKRLGLELRRTGLPPAKPKPKRFKRHNDAVIVTPRPPTPTPKNEPDPIGPPDAFPLRGCKFIRGEVVRGWRCCGADCWGSWCSYHRPLVFQPMRKT